MAIERQVERQALFGNKDRTWTDPQTLLLDNLLNELPQEEQILQITKVLKESWSQDGKAIVLVDALEKIFDSRATFQTHLQTVYTNIPAKAKVGSYWDDPEQRNRLIPIEGDAAPELKLNILDRILWGWEKPSSNPYHQTDQQHIEACFQFVCNAYKSADWDGTLRKGMLKIFGKHTTYWEPIQLDPWIIRKDTPREIAGLLLTAQLQNGGVDLVRQRLRDTTLLPSDRSTSS